MIKDLFRALGVLFIVGLGLAYLVLSLQVKPKPEIQVPVKITYHVDVITEWSEEKGWNWVSRRIVE